MLPCGQELVSVIMTGCLSNNKSKPQDRMDRTKVEAKKKKERDKRVKNKQYKI